MSLEFNRLRALLILGAVIATSLCLATPALGASVTINGVVYTTDDNTATANVSSYTGDLRANVTIRSTITDGRNTYNITGVAESAFAYAGISTSSPSPTASAPSKTTRSLKRPA